ncbi:MAG: hypothetical protein U5L11_06400 [Arhodomonas sp.]|nr:hypothetical protein [Arhodomonas sp.]
MPHFGLPLAVFGFGEHALPIAVVMFVVENTLHFTVGLWLLTRRVGFTQLLGNPMVPATAAGLLCMAMDWHAPAMILPGVEMLGDIRPSLMLVALGIRLTEIDLSYWRIGLGGGLLAPLTGLAIAVPWVLIFQPPQPLAGLLLLSGALPPAVLNYMLSRALRPGAPGGGLHRRHGEPLVPGRDPAGPRLCPVGASPYRGDTPCQHP